jgi:hypothetical protein
MATHSTKEIIPPMPEPWQTLSDLAYWLDEVRARATKGDSAAANAELRDALRAAMLDLLTVVKFYRTDREHPSDPSGELVPRFTVMALHADGSTAAHGIFPTEREAVEAATRLTTETAEIADAWVRRSLVPVLVEQAHEALARFLAETGLTEDELADAVIHHPA